MNTVIGEAERERFEIGHGLVLQIELVRDLFGPICSETIPLKEDEAH